MTPHFRWYCAATPLERNGYVISDGFLSKEVACRMKRERYSEDQKLANPQPHALPKNEWRY